MKLLALLLAIVALGSFSACVSHTHSGLSRGAGNPGKLSGPGHSIPSAGFDTSRNPRY